MLCRHRRASYMLVGVRKSRVPCVYVCVFCWIWKALWLCSMNWEKKNNKCIWRLCYVWLVDWIKWDGLLFLSPSLGVICCSPSCFDIVGLDKFFHFKLRDIFESASPKHRDSVFAESLSIFEHSAPAAVNSCDNFAVWLRGERLKRKCNWKK